MTYEEIEARKAEIKTELETEGADIDKLTEEVRSLNDQLTEMRKNEAAKAELRKAVAEGNGVTIATTIEPKKDESEERTKMFAETKRTSMNTAEMRSVLVSGGTLATPTGVSGIYDIVGAESGLLEMLNVVNCEGMGGNKVAYIAAEAGASATQTEGSAATTKEPTFGYVTITPTSVACIAQISKQAKKQSPLMYEEKVKAQALLSLRKKARDLVHTQLIASSLIDTVAATVASNKGVIDAGTLRKLVLQYGNDESVCGNAVLVLNRADLVAFGDVRGTNEKKPVYTITPDGQNPNKGTIADGGLVVNYIIDNHFTACHGTTESSTADTLTMVYGNWRNMELDLFSNYEIAVSEDFAFTSLMDTIRGDVELGCDVIAKHGFVALKIPQNP